MSIETTVYIAMVAVSAYMGVVTMLTVHISQSTNVAVSAYMGVVTSADMRKGSIDYSCSLRLHGSCDFVGDVAITNKFVAVSAYMGVVT